ncbi:catalase [Neoasaia chiangmaiensis NBRC 101099]|uniref:Catalase n=1 Tax=Neoasaia chiangmaiensis TaxID=320497 RepID=A0A1U9KQN9_9PROT|nr:catalase family protein [Neoasaia chiangmaiensis]AQS88050.1 catalase [Neoasaia chiangmaiensis]GBR38785.1 catalase [Neoasaia chiangmaiensis NBRC 101099]GEN15725.1 catalase [Neoasaia chiangmaiensis]
MLSAPLPYFPDVETPQPDEDRTHRALIATFRKIITKTHRDLGHAQRGVHAKSHALLHGEFRVHPDLPPELAQGLFAEPGTYAARVRLSSIPADPLRDTVSVPRGFALKIIGVRGERLPGSENDTTQDFLFANGPAFATPDAKSFLSGMRLLALTTDRMEWAKAALSHILRAINAILAKCARPSPLLAFLGGYAPTNPLGDRFCSQVPFRFGQYMAKFDIVPESDSFRALTDRRVDLRRDPDAIRTEIREILYREGGRWTLRAQLCRDLERNPIENAAAVWPEDHNPYLPVATIDVPPQESWSESLSREMDDGLSFAPWHGLTAHRPLGNIMRARRVLYPVSVGLRSDLNRCPVHEPRT